MRCIDNFYLFGGRKMKIKHVFFVLVTFILAATFFMTCGGSDPDPDPVVPPDSRVTYTLTVPNITIAQGRSQDVAYTLAASDNSSTAGIAVTFVCADTTPNVPSVNKSTITATSATPVAAYNFTATAAKEGETVAAKAFTVTVRAPAANEVFYTLGVDPISVAPGASATGSYTLTASDNTTSGITVTVAAADTVPSLTASVISGNNIRITATAAAPVGSYNFIATAKKGTEVVDVKSFIVIVSATYSLTLRPPAKIAHDEVDAVIGYTLTGDATGTTYDISVCSEHSSCPLVVSNNASRRRFQINGAVPRTVVVGEHKFVIKANKSGETKASANLTLKVTPSYTLAFTSTSYNAPRGGTLDITYTLTASDGSNTNWLSVGCSCSTDYSNCDLFTGTNWRSPITGISVPAGAALNKVHGIKVQVDDATDDANWVNYVETSTSVTVVAGTGG